MPEWDAVVLAGGRGRRLGGVDKPALVVGRRTLLDVALAACVGARHTVVVGPRRPTARAVSWTREEPPGTGPLAALAAGLRALPTGVPVVVVLAADLPEVSPAAVGTLVDGVAADNAAAADDATTTHGTVAVDGDGRRQPLLAAYRRDALTAALARIGQTANRPVHLLLDALDLAEVPSLGAAADIDTPGDLARWEEGRS